MSRFPPRLVACALLVLNLATSAEAGEPPRRVPTEPVRATQSDPCTFYRVQAYGKGLGHFSTEMLWACEAIRARRLAGMPLGDRLLAVEAVLEEFRHAVVSANRTGSMYRRGPAAAKRAQSLAESTGALLALEGIRTGF
jgi:hypothetical protein